MVAVDMLETEAAVAEDQAMRLSLPPLDGRSVLHVGCGEGDLCGYVRAQGASAVLGVDDDPQALSRARVCHADLTFGLASWDEFLPTRRYDVVVMTSPLAHAASLDNVVARAMTLLTPHGLLILCVALAADTDSGWSDTPRHGAVEHRPTQAKLFELLAPYQYELLPQPADGGLAIVHCRHRQPLALLVSGLGVSEDALLAQTLSSPGRVDVFTKDMAWRALSASPVGARMIDALDMPAADGGEIIRALLDRGLATTLVEQWFARTRPAMIVLDGVIGDDHVKDVRLALESIGYRVWTAQPHISTSSLASRRQTLLVAGEPFVITPGQAAGAVDRVSISNQGLAISGWAMDKERQTRIDNFVVYYQDLQLQILGAEASERPDVADHGLCLPGQTCGFHLKVALPPQTYAEGAFDPDAVQVYGLIAQRRAALI